MNSNILDDSNKADKETRLNNLKKVHDEKIKQDGIEFPRASEQSRILIVRLNLTHGIIPNGDNNRNENEVKQVRDGLKRLCGLFDRIRNGDKKFIRLNSQGNFEAVSIADPNTFNFTATIGFGSSFFEKMGISSKDPNDPSKPNPRSPRNLFLMPDNEELGDPSKYGLAQTDLIIQLGSTDDAINRWVLENRTQPEEQEGLSDPKDDCPDGINPPPGKRCCPDGQVVNEKIGEKCTPDIVHAISDWAIITDVNTGFQRVDGRNLLGFNDGVSNPRPGSGAKFDDIVWTTKEDESEILANGTYMVFQKIEHDLDQWCTLSLDEQEEWVGRKKITGLLKGTLTDDEDKKLAQDLYSSDNSVRQNALTRLNSLFNDPQRPQKDPTFKAYDHQQFRDAVPAWSHIRKANPREELIPTALTGDHQDHRIGGGHIIFRRGYLFVENADDNKVRSGLQFVCFQRNIVKQGFQFLKTVWLNNKNFPKPIFAGSAAGPLTRKFTDHELNERHKKGTLTGDELVAIRNSPDKRNLIGLGDDDDFNVALRNAGVDPATDNPIIDPVTNKPIITDTQNTGREGLEGPSELGTVLTGEFVAIEPHGGGYYFVPPIPNKQISEIGQQFFG